jgi:hypothetical protein
VRARSSELVAEAVDEDGQSHLGGETRRRRRCGGCSKKRIIGIARPRRAGAARSRAGWTTTRSRSRLRRGATWRRHGRGSGPDAAASCSLVRHRRRRDRAAAEGLQSGLATKTTRRWRWRPVFVASLRLSLRECAASCALVCSCSSGVVVRSARRSERSRRVSAVREAQASRGETRGTCPLEWRRRAAAVLRGLTTASAQFRRRAPTPSFRVANVMLEEALASGVVYHTEWSACQFSSRKAEATTHLQFSWGATIDVAGTELGNNNCCFACRGGFGSTHTVSAD